MIRTAMDPEPQPDDGAPPPSAPGEQKPPAPNRSGCGCLPLLLAIAALWFWFGPWDAARDRAGRMQERVQALERRVDSLRAAREAPPRADTARVAEAPDVEPR